MGVLAFASAILIFAPWLIFKKHRLNKYFVRFQFLVTIALVINGAGGLGLYRAGFEYDKMAHYATSLILVFAFLILFHHFWDRSTKRALINSALLVLSLGLFWEVLEHVTNLVFDVDVFVLGGGGSIWVDTILDVVANTLGITTACLYIKQKFARGVGDKLNWF
jgi:glycopeptide antibiotics resistance protein